MKLDQLNYFVQAARREHIGNAAKALSVCSSAISHSIIALERELGITLLSRNKKKMRLTNEGKVVAEQAEFILNQVAYLKEAIVGGRLDSQRHYRLGACQLLCASRLVPAWIGVQEQNRNHTAEIVCRRSSEVIGQVLSGELDLGLCLNPQTHPDLEVEVVEATRMVLAVRRGHPLIKISVTKRLSNLSQYAAVLFKSYPGIEEDQRNPIFEKFNIEPKVDCWVDSHEAMIAQIGLSLSWGFLPEWMARDSQLVVISPDCADWDAACRVCAVWSKERSLTKTMGQIVEGMRRPGSVSAGSGKRQSAVPQHREKRGPVLVAGSSKGN